MKFAFKFLVIFLFAFSFSNSQTTYYLTTDSLLMTEENYLQIKKEINEREDLAGRYQEIFIKSEKRNDTILNRIKFEKIHFVMGLNLKEYDPYAELRKLIGTRFPIEIFKNENNQFFSSDYLRGKPAVVNFWFTNCPPCVEEIPDLVKLKNEYSEAVNFIAITFDPKKKVEKFLTKRPYFDYMHITNSQRQIDKLNIKSYPVTLLLDKEGKIINIYGGSISVGYQSLTELLNLLL